MPSQAVRSPLGNCDRYGPRSQHTARLRCPPGASILQSRVSIEIWAPDPLAPSGARRSTSRALRSRRIAGFTPSALAVFTAWHPRAYRPSSSSSSLARLRSFVPKPFVNQLAALTESVVEPAQKNVVCSHVFASARRGDHGEIDALWEAELYMEARRA